MLQKTLGGNHKMTLGEYAACFTCAATSCSQTPATGAGEHFWKCLDLPRSRPPAPRVNLSFLLKQTQGGTKRVTATLPNK